MTYYCDYCHSPEGHHTLVSRSEDGYSGRVLCYFCLREIGEVKWRPFSMEPGQHHRTHATEHAAPPDAGRLSVLTNDDVRRAIELLCDLIDECKRSVRVSAEEGEVVVSDKIPELNDKLQDILRGALPGGLKERDA